MLLCVPSFPMALTISLEGKLSSMGGHALYCGLLGSFLPACPFLFLPTFPMALACCHPWEGKNTIARCRFETFQLAVALAKDARSHCPFVWALATMTL